MYLDFICGMGLPPLSGWRWVTEVEGRTLCRMRCWEGFAVGPGVSYGQHRRWVESSVSIRRLFCGAQSNSVASV